MPPPSEEGTSAQEDPLSPVPAPINLPPAVPALRALSMAPQAPRPPAAPAQKAPQGPAAKTWPRSDALLDFLPGGLRRGDTLGGGLGSPYGGGWT